MTSSAAATGAERKDLNRLALGTVQFGLNYGMTASSDKVSLTEARRILDEAADIGMNTLDTAIAYGNSEAVLGQIGVQEFNIVTKLSGLPDDLANVGDWVKTQIHASLERLGVDRVHAVLLHRPDQLTGPIGAELYKAMLGLKAEGLAVKIGVSIYAPDELDVYCEHFDIDIVQAPLNILDRRLIESGWAAKLRRRGIELHSRSAFLQGLLLLQAEDRPKTFAKWQPIWTEWEQ